MRLEIISSIKICKCDLHFYFTCVHLTGGKTTCLKFVTLWCKHKQQIKQILQLGKLVGQDLTSRFCAITVIILADTKLQLFTGHDSW